MYNLYIKFNGIMKIYNLKCFDILIIICALCMGASYHTIKLEDPLIKLLCGVTAALLQFDLNTSSPFISLNPLSWVLIKSYFYIYNNYRDKNQWPTPNKLTTKKMCPLGWKAWPLKCVTTPCKEHSLSPSLRSCMVCSS